MSLQIYEDYNSISDEAFVKKWSLNGKNPTKNDTNWSEVTDKNGNKVYKMKECTKKKDGETVMDFPWDVCVKDDEKWYFQLRREMAKTIGTASLVATALAVFASCSL